MTQLPLAPLSLPSDEPRPDLPHHALQPSVLGGFTPTGEEEHDPVCTVEFALHSRELDRIVRATPRA